MRSGVFNTQIDVAIGLCKDFLLVLSPHSMDRCVEEGDWVAHEIREALKAGCNIVPIAIDQNFTDWPKDMPRDLNVMKLLQQRIMARNELFDASVKLIADMLVSEPSNFETSQEPTCNLTISSDETSLLYVDGQAKGKVKSGGNRVLQLATGGRYVIKLESLARKGESLTQEVQIGESMRNSQVSFSFAATREEQKRKEQEQRTAAKQAKELQYHKQGALKQMLETYDKHGETDEGMTPVCRGDLWGFVDSDGFEIIPCRYLAVTQFFEGQNCAWVLKKKDEWILVDSSGNILTPTPFYSFEPPRLGYTSGYLDEMKTQVVMDTKGRELFRVTDDNVYHTDAEGLFVYYSADSQKCFLIDTQQRRLSREYDLCAYYEYQFHAEGNIKHKDMEWIMFPLEVRQNGKWGFLGKDGREIIPCISEILPELVGDDKEDGYYIVRQHGKYGVVNLNTRQFPIPPTYDWMTANGWHYPTVVVSRGGIVPGIQTEENGRIENSHFHGGQQGVLTRDGQILVPLKYHQILTQEDRYFCRYFKNPFWVKLYSDENNYHVGGTTEVDDCYDLNGTLTSSKEEISPSWPGCERKPYTI
jgi:hypothetical protein